MANPYEVEHNIKEEKKRHTTRPDMSTFFSQLSQIETASTTSRTHNNPNAIPTPADIAATERLLQDQLSVFLSHSSNDSHSAFLTSLLSTIESTIDSPPTTTPGVPQSYLDELERVPKKELKKGDICPICAEKFLDDEYPLVVQLPCHKTHRFDLECVGPWLRLQGTCPLDRKEMGKRKEVVVEKDAAEEDYDEMFA